MTTCIYLIRNTVQYCAGLNEDNTWSQVDDTVWETLGTLLLLEKVYDERQILKFQACRTFIESSICLLLMGQYVISQLSLLPCPCLDVMDSNPLK